MKEVKGSDLIVGRIYQYKNTSNPSSLRFQGNYFHHEEELTKMAFINVKTNTKVDIRYVAYSDAIWLERTIKFGRK